MNGLLNNNSTSIRMRPASASVDVDMPNDDAVQDVYVIETSSGLNAITTKTTNHGRSFFTFSLFNYSFYRFPRALYLLH